MRKHFKAILTPLVVSIFAFVAVSVTAHSNHNSTNYKSNSKKESSLDIRKKSFSKKWEMRTWSKSI